MNLFLTTLAVGFALILQSPAAHAWTYASGFSMPGSAIAFHNYSIWANSSLPDRMQLPHCTSMALLVRQVHLHARFEPGPYKLPPTVYRMLLDTIYARSTSKGPSASADRITIPGYSNFFEMSSDPAIEPMIHDVLGNSVTDILRSGFNWSPEDALIASASSWVRDRHEKKLKGILDRGLPAMVYLTDGTATAHAVLLYGYEDLGGYDEFVAYDSNHMGGPVTLRYWKFLSKMDHPDLGDRDPWVLHPY